MTTLRIDDLTHSNELDSSQMAAVSGGLDVNKAVGAVVDAIALGIGLLTGSCEVSKTGKSTVCY
jgi:hypothetical protein